MVFQFRARGVSKDEVKDLYERFSRAFRKRSNNPVEVACELFLEIVFLYFDNDERENKRKPKDRYYLFNKVRVAVKVFINENDEISYEEDPVTVEAYDHPFTKDVQRFGHISIRRHNH